MTHEEIEARRRELQDVLEKHAAGRLKDGDARSVLQELAQNVGASTRVIFLKNTVSGTRHECIEADIPELAYNIHQALQTASMIDACQTAAKNSEIALKAQADSRSLRRIAFAAMLAAWGAVVANLIAARTNNGSGLIYAGATAGAWDWADSIAIVAVLVAVYAAWVARLQLKYQALAELMQDYSQDNMSDAASELWGFYEKCNESENELRRRFAEMLDNKDSREKPVDRYRRRVSHFYQRMAGLYLMGALPKRHLYRHWTKWDLRIIPLIIVPMEEEKKNALVRRHSGKQDDKKLGDKKPENALYHLTILYEEADMNWIRRTWRWLQRWWSPTAPPTAFSPASPSGAVV